MRVIRYVLIFILIAFAIALVSVLPAIINADEKENGKSDGMFVIAWLCASVIGGLLAIVCLYLRGW